jgi:hypothetical protein
VLNPPLIDASKKDRRVGEQLLAVLSRKQCRGRADRHDQVQPLTRKAGPQIVDDRLLLKSPG